MPKIPPPAPNQKKILVFIDTHRNDRQSAWLQNLRKRNPPPLGKHGPGSVKVCKHRVAVFGKAHVCVLHAAWKTFCSHNPNPPLKTPEYKALASFVHFSYHSFA